MVLKELNHGARHSIAIRNVALAGNGAHKYVVLVQGNVSLRSLSEYNPNFAAEADIRGVPKSDLPSHQVHLPSVRGRDATEVRLQVSFPGLKFVF